MAYQRKLGRTAAQRKALLRNQVTNLIWYGRIETTLARAKEVRSAAEHLITLAIRECDNTVSVEKTFNNDKGQSVTVTVQNAQLFELAFRDAAGQLVPAAGGGALLDEQAAVPDTISQLNSMYFDEI